MPKNDARAELENEVVIMRVLMVVNEVVKGRQELLSYHLQSDSRAAMRSAAPAMWREVKS